MEVIHEGNDARGIYPNIDGATIELDFGYGSEFDDCRCKDIHQSAICDECYRAHRDRVRTVAVRHCPPPTWTEWHQKDTNKGDPK